MQKDEIRQVGILTTKEIIKDFSSLPADISEVEWIGKWQYDKLESDLQKAQARIRELEFENENLRLSESFFQKKYDDLKSTISEEKILETTDQLKLDLQAADLILLSISEPTWSDERLSYVEVQMSREDYKALQEYLAKKGGGNGKA